MGKSSTITGQGASARQQLSASGDLAVRAEILLIRTDERIQLTDVTDRVSAFVTSSGVREGVVSLWSMHTTCSLFINETQKALHHDIKSFLERTVARDGEWLHNDPQHSDCDRMNADAHLRAMLLGHSLTVQVTAGALVLGQWQRILIAELDGPRERSIRLQVMGVTQEL